MTTIRIVRPPSEAGPEAWSDLHRWAQGFHAAVGDSCGCGRFAEAAARGLHDAVNVHLGKPVRHPADLAAVSAFFAQAVAAVESHAAHAEQDVLAMAQAREAEVAAEVAEMLRLDPFGSRCRGPLGQWIETAECGPFPTDGKAVGTDLTFAIGADGSTRYEFRFELSEADDLIASHDEHTFELDPRFPPELQPRLRGRAATRLQVERMAKGINPVALLTDFRTLDRGAPIVGPDMIVESGNGRVMALKRAITDFPESYARYRAYLTMHAGEYGMTARDVEEMEHPVLVRVRLSNVDRVAFSREGNASAAISVSSVEKAKIDAEGVTSVMLSSLVVGETQSIEEAIRSPSNRAFVQAFLAKIPENEQAAIVDAKGDLNMDGVRRIALAVFLAAFPGTVGLRIAEKAFESNDLEVRNVTNGISRSLGVLAQAETMAREGERSNDLAIGDSLAKVVNTLSVIKRSPGMTVEKYLAQGAFERELTSFEEAMLRDLGERARSGKRVAELLTAFAQRVISLPPPAQGGLFGPSTVSREQLWEAAVRESAMLEPAPREQTSLFQDVQPMTLDPKTRIEWGERVDASDIDALWAWAPFRDVVAGAIGNKAVVRVDGIGLTGREYQLTIKLNPAFGSLKGRLDTITDSANRALRRFGRPVWTSDRYTLIWEIALPLDDGGDLEWKPQTVQPREREMVGAVPQPRLFQGGLLYDYSPKPPLMISEPSVIVSPGPTTVTGIIPPEYADLKVETRLDRAPRIHSKRAPMIERPEDVQPFFRLMRGADREWILAIFVATDGRVIGLMQTNIGTIDSSVVDSTAIMRVAILTGARAVFIAHNHPSGNPMPSTADRHLYDVLRGAFKPFNVDVNDFFVVGTVEDFSIKGERTLPAPSSQIVQPEPKRIEREIEAIVGPAGPQPRLFRAHRHSELSETAILLDISGEGEFVRERVAEPEKFDPDSFRTVPQADHRVIVGKRRGQETTETQSILHPRSEATSLIADALERGIPVLDESQQAADDILQTMVQVLQ